MLRYAQGFSGIITHLFVEDTQRISLQVLLFAVLLSGICWAYSGLIHLAPFSNRFLTGEQRGMVTSYSVLADLSAVTGLSVVIIEVVLVGISFLCWSVLQVVQERRCKPMRQQEG